MKKTLIFVLLLMVGGFASAYDGYVFITNQTGYTIYYVYADHTDTQTWGNDHLGDNVLSDGLSLKVSLYDIPTSIVDIQVEDEDGDTYTFYGLDLATMDELIVTFDDLD